jgi:uncharacterized protein YbjT (DUF2867 family)
VKYLVEAKLNYGLPARGTPGGLSWTVLGPSLFFDNDYLFKEQMLERGAYPWPFGNKGVSRVDTEDIALAVANALEDDGRVWGGKKVMIGSVGTYTTRETVDLWSQALRRDVKPTLSNQEGFNTVENDFGQVAGPVWGRDIRLIFETFAERRFDMSEENYKEQVEPLGKEPKSYKIFIEVIGKQWTES